MNENGKETPISSSLEAAIAKCIEVEDRFSAFSESLKVDGALPRKQKTLISLALAVSKSCVWCVRNYTAHALDQGVSTEQIIEAAAMAVQMDGGTGSAALRHLALKAIEEYENGYRAQKIGADWELVKVS
jgi:AhpD family alkylhydroperoxidase